jgi:hypothetical protein
VVLAATACVLTHFARWEAPGLWRRTPPTPAPETAGLAVTLQRTKVIDDTYASFAIRGLPEDLGVSAVTDHTLRWKNGEEFRSYSRFSVGTWPGLAEWRALGLGARATESTRAAYLAQAPDAEESSGMSLRARFPIQPGALGRLQTDAPAYRGDVHLTLWRPKILCELPLRPGASTRIAGDEVRIGLVSWAEGELFILCMLGEPDWLHYANRPVLARMAQREERPGDALVLVNRQRGEAVRLWGYHGKAPTLNLEPQAISWPSVHTKIPRDAAEIASGAQPRWLEGATLVVLRYEPVAHADREVTAPRFSEHPGSLATK